MKSVVVSGVSSGIGRGLARELVGRGYRVFGSVRREEDAGRLAAELGANFRPLVFDVTDRAAVLRAAKEVGEELDGSGLAGLVNNAGTTLMGPMMHQPLDEVRTMFETNAIGLVSVTQAFLPLLGATRSSARPPGRILNIGSVSGRLATPFMAAYAGSKHAVEGVTDALRCELLPYGIDVVLIQAGPVKTKQLGKTTTAGHKAAYAGTDYAGALANFFKISENATKGGFSAEDFAKRVADTFEARRPRTRYTLIRQKLTYWTIPILLPDRVRDRVFGWSAGLLKRPVAERATEPKR